MANAAARDEALLRRAQSWIDDPLGAHGHSNTAIHSVPRGEAEAVQLAALNLSLESRRDTIAMVGRLADSQGVTSFASLDAAAPMLFTHDVYKSYPTSLLARQRFDQLTRWLSRLTPYDLSAYDATGCTGIDDWLTGLREATGLDVATSSGTSGTCSFFPKSAKDYRTSVMLLRIQLTQGFGDNPGAASLDEAWHVLTPFYRDGHSTVARLPAYFLDVFCRGDEARLQTALPWKASADLMWLAARLRAARSRGDAGRIDVPDTLLARRGEWEALAAEMPARQAAFIREMIPKLAGERVLALGITGMFWEIAKAGLEAGTRAEFAPGSVVTGGGGGKGLVLPDDAEATICRFFGVPALRDSFGMTEQNFYLNSCELGRFHVPPWVVVLLLDPGTGQPLPREREQTGRAAFFDLSQVGAWGGIVSGDRVSVSYDPCGCGRTTLHLAKKIQRFSELTGEDDKLTCAATPAAQAEALGFLNAL